MRKRAALCLTLGMACLGCGDTEPDGSPSGKLLETTDPIPAEDPKDSFPMSGEALGRVTASSSKGTFQVAISTVNGDPIPLNEPFAVTVDLTDPDGQPWKGAERVTLDARMPAHRHGMLRDVELEEIAPGRFQAEGLLFHMIGHWEFHVDTVQGPSIERATADVWLKF